MNFQTILEELDRLYEEDKAKSKTVAEKTTDEDSVQEEQKETVITEAADGADNDEEIEIVEDEDVEETEEAPAEEEPADVAQLVLECSNCGAVVIKPETDVNNSDESDLVDTGEACQYCEAKDGYSILGVIAPYEPVVEEVPVDEEPVEEGLLGIDMPISVDIEANGNNVPVLNAGI